MKDVSVRVSSGLKMESVADFSKELRDKGEDVFRRSYPCSFLVVVYSPPADIGWGSDVTTKTSHSGAGAVGFDGMVKSTKWAIPLLKSEPGGRAQFISVGRMGKVDIGLRSSKISKHHASLAKEKDGGYLLLDMGSANGTLVNGDRLEPSRRYRLKSGDMVSMWRYLFQFVELEPFLILLRKKNLPAW